MKESFLQALDNLRANKLRSFLTMFGIMWGIVSIVVLSAMGEGFQRGNEAVLREFGRNMSIVWASRTTMQAGGERAGRLLNLTADDARAIKTQGRLVSMVSPEIQRGTKVKSAYNEAAVTVHGVEPPYMFMRTIEVDRGRQLNWSDEENESQVGVIGWEMSKQLFGDREPVGEQVLVNGTPFKIVGRIRRKDQDSNYSGPDNNKLFIPFAVMSKYFPRPDAPAGSLSQLIVMPRQEVVDSLESTLTSRTGRVADIDWPLQREIREILARRKEFNPEDRYAISVWDTSLQTMFFDRMISAMAAFFRVVGLVTLALGGIGVMNIMLIAVRDRTREIGVRKALGATTAAIQRQFFLEGFFLTMISGGLGMLIGVGLCTAVNVYATLPIRFSGMVITWSNALLALGSLVVIGVVSSTLPARKAAQLPPTEALRYEM
ncbi:Macrolide export ATP-binding/permease protein MacB [Luteitalea pratensis]|uniref:Macrolide export ATP-binding/permease protein MacB n=1 Tax=Luteitalea pratensis TaxID=1855912 RepID=A0A143PXE9_LUTPR|nr:ABC transporter permease [Luteitalea pratensis]AMY12740.1 Macrolide export ATP-binding/permease protein MacB [Luteitalea pratensis]